LSIDTLVEEALKRQDAFHSLPRYLQTIKKTALKLDPEAEVYLFGSVAENKHNYSSDIDILIVTRTHPGQVLAEMWKAGIEEPFEIHVHTSEEAEFFRRNAKLVKV
jgi:uncharacterized protein